MYISQASLKRLPKYLRILKEKKKAGFEYVSSTTVAEELYLNSIQVRKDLSLVSKKEGKPKIGFEIKELIYDLEEFLNINNMTDVILVGAGKLGQALMNYKGFENNTNILMAFDNDLDKCDNKKIFYIDRMENLIKRMNIHIGIVAVPKEKAQGVCDRLIKCGIKAIWNFAPTNLKVPEDIIVKNEDLSVSLLVLLNKLKSKECQK